MRTVTKTFAVCTPRELKEKFPKRFQKELDKWQAHEPSWDWWEHVCNDFSERPYMYVPAVTDYFKNYPPATWPDGLWPDELQQLTETWAEVIEVLGDGVKEFDLYHRTIQLGEVRVNLHKFVALAGFTHEHPLAVDALLADIGPEETVCVVWDRGEVALQCFSEGLELEAEAFLHNTFGAPIVLVPNLYSGDAVDLAVAMGDCRDQLEAALKKFLDDIKEAVLDALQAEYDYLCSEEYFLEQDHMEFEVELEEVHG